jgi:hypothetical protein
MPKSGYDSEKMLIEPILMTCSEECNRDHRREFIMASLFECEIRFPIADVDAFRRHLKAQGGTILFPYEFTDYYFKPVGDETITILPSR